jgi:hypothetical protein
MIGTAALTALVALIGVFLLDQLVVVETNWPVSTVTTSQSIYIIMIFRESTNWNSITTKASLLRLLLSNS